MRLACLLHDLGKPDADATPELDHARGGRRVADRVLRRLRYPTRLRQQVVAHRRGHGFRLDGEVDARAARRFLAEHGDELALDLLRTRPPTSPPSASRRRSSDRLARARRDALRSERSQPHRIGDLASTAPT